jgi:hypothetical protein
MTVKLLNELDEKFADASEEERIAFIEEAASKDAEELMQIYDLDLIAEAFKREKIELNLLAFILDLHGRFRSRLIRRLGMRYANLRYGKDTVTKALRLGQNLSRK